MNLPIIHLLVQSRVRLEEEEQGDEEVEVEEKKVI